MRYRFVSEEVLYPGDRVVAVSAEDINHLKLKRQSTTRKRIRLCAHQKVEDALHEMLIVHTKDTYVRPHLHLAKSESYHAIEGCFDLITFDDNGNVTSVFEIGPFSSGRNFFCRLPAGLYHGLIIRSDIIVFHETTTGPFLRSQTQFAAWAPEENEIEAGNEFMRKALLDWEPSPNR
jgi:cupin fold WbuC family metalloprotein